MDGDTKINFIVVSLCNNDYPEIRDGLTDLIENWGLDFCPFVAKEYIIEYTRSRKHLKGLVTGFGTDDTRNVSYLRDNLRVTFEQKRPTEDHDHGSCYFDIHLGQVFSD
jgi:hypothetical protein